MGRIRCRTSSSVISLYGRPIVARAWRRCGGRASTGLAGVFCCEGIFFSGEIERGGVWLVDALRLRILWISGIPALDMRRHIAARATRATPAHHGSSWMLSTSMVITDHTSGSCTRQKER